MTDPIKTKIQELCPDVMDLKFGCFVNPTSDSVQMVIQRLIVDYANVIEIFEDEGATIASAPKRVYPKVILGSPITLAVVLRAIAAEPSKYTCWIDAECFDTPHFLLQKKRARYKDEQPILVWNLEQDNYDAQSQETKDFIGSLLGV